MFFSCVPLAVTAPRIRFISLGHYNIITYYIGAGWVDLIIITQADPADDVRLLQLMTVVRRRTRLCARGGDGQTISVGRRAEYFNCY